MTGREGRVGGRSLLNGSEIVIAKLCTPMVRCVWSGAVFRCEDFMPLWGNVIAAGGLAWECLIAQLAGGK